MIDWEPKDSIPDLREKISFLRRALRDAHRREAHRREEIAEVWNKAIEDAAKELQHHLTTGEDVALSEVWQERILDLKKENTYD